MVSHLRISAHVAKLGNIYWKIDKQNWDKGRTCESLFDVLPHKKMFPLICTNIVILKKNNNKKKYRQEKQTDT